MLYMNEYDIRAAMQRYKTPGKASAVLRKATRFLWRLYNETNEHSDGWAYWPKPCRAARKLMELIQAGGNPSESDYRKALAPIRAFYTRDGYAVGMRFPPATDCAD
jgi:hypothetical protein